MKGIEKGKIRKKISIITICLIVMFVAIISVITVKSINKTNALENSEYRTITLKINFENYSWSSYFDYNSLMTTKSNKINSAKDVYYENILMQKFLYEEGNTKVYSIDLKAENKYLLFDGSILYLDNIKSDNSEIVYIYCDDESEDRSMLSAFSYSDIAYGMKILDDQDVYEINISDVKEYIDVEIDASEVEEAKEAWCWEIIANDRLVENLMDETNNKIFNIEVPYLDFEEYGIIIKQIDGYKMVEDGIELDEKVVDYSHINGELTGKFWYKAINKDNIKDKYNLKIVKEYEEVGKEVTLKYDANVSENEDVVVPESEVKEVSNSVAEFTISDMIPIREGYKFLGWSNDKDTNRVDYNLGEKISISEDKTIYAVWEEDKIFTNKHGSYRVIHEYYTKDNNGNITLEDKVTLDTVNNIEVGKIVGILNDDVDIEIAKELIHTVNGVEYTYEYLEDSGNIVIEEDVEKDITIKYVRDKNEDIGNNIDTSDINIWLYVVIFVIAVIVIAIVLIFINRKK